MTEMTQTRDAGRLLFRARLKVFLIASLVWAGFLAFLIVYGATTARRGPWNAFVLNSLVAWAVIGGFVLPLASAFLFMRNLWTMTRREVGSLILSPVAWIVMCAFLVAFGIIFSQSLEGIPYATMSPTFYVMTLILAFAVPILTMRQVAEERRSGTIETLTTAPVTDVELVLGKFFGAVSFYFFILVPTLFYVWVLFHYSSSGADVWMLASDYMGIVLMGLFMLSFGLFVSCISREQIVAAAVGMITLFLLWLLGHYLPPNPPVSLSPTFWAHVQSALYTLGSFLAFGRHYQPFSQGVVDTKEIIFFLSFTVFFLFLAVATVSTRKWR
jgi:ABC-2 type transport system permease protein